MAPTPTHSPVGMGTSPPHTSPPRRRQRLDLGVDSKSRPLRISGHATEKQDVSLQKRVDWQVKLIREHFCDEYHS